MHANIGHPGSECRRWDWLEFGEMWRDSLWIRRRSDSRSQHSQPFEKHEGRGRCGRGSPLDSASGDWLTCSARKVSIVPFVLEAVVLEQIGVGQELFDDAEADRLREGLRIRDGDREIEMTVVAAAEALLDAHVLAVAR